MILFAFVTKVKLNKYFTMVNKVICAIKHFTYHQLIFYFYNNCTLFTQEQNEKPNSDQFTVFVIRYFHTILSFLTSTTPVFS
jgi:hypothetical protein